MKRVIFLNRFFYPDHSATSQIVSDLAFHLAASGMDVHVITSGQLYDSPRALLAKEEIVNGVHIHRMPTTRFGRSGLLGRAIDYASYYGLMWHRASSLAGAGDILVAKTDPPLTSIVAMRVAQQTKARLVNWLQDIYPGIAGELGVPLMRGMFGRALCRLRDHSLRRAAANVVVGRRMAERLQSFGVASHHVHVIPNWSDDEALCAVRSEENPLHREWGLERKFVVGYSGNLGRAHEIDTVLSAAALLRDHPHIVFLFIGGGNPPLIEGTNNAWNLEVHGKTICSTSASSRKSAIYIRPIFLCRPGYPFDQYFFLNPHHAGRLRHVWLRGWN
jgi:glycosyltransferase involved in cell wall biosynthesis